MCRSVSFFLSSIVPVVVFFFLCVLLSPDRASSPLVVSDTTSRALVNGLVAKERPTCVPLDECVELISGASPKTIPTNQAYGLLSPPPTSLSSLTLGPPLPIEPRLSKPIRKKKRKKGIVASAVIGSLPTRTQACLNEWHHEGLCPNQPLSFRFRKVNHVFIPISICPPSY